MGTIKLLDTHTINKIAAGEVVERPAAVVKELVENSIDAGASTVTVEIKNGGIDLIRVTDNGRGIPKDEVEIAFLRHATSKITSADDLLEVLSLGFRGEALASIGAVSKTELITKTPGALTGKRVAVQAGKPIESEEIACPEGTTLTIRQLFYNVPARKAFLKSTSSEASRIADTMYKLAMAHPEIAFKYIQNNKLIFTTSGNRDLKQVVFQLYGKETAKQVIPFHYEQEGVEVSGLLGTTQLTRANRQYEHFFINGRTIKSYTLQKAVEEGYKTLITIGKFPFAIIHLHIQPDTVDVNVHPTKLEVRFKESEHIAQIVETAVRQSLRQQSHIPDVATPKIKPQAIVDTTKEAVQQVRVESFIQKYQPPEPFTPQRPIENVASSHLFEKVKPQETVHVHEASSSYRETVVAPEEDTPQTQAVSLPTPQKSEQVVSVEVKQPDEVKPAQVPIDYKIVGQLFDTYWLIEYNEELFLIDQHAAHERVMYEHYMRDFMQATVHSQVLLFPETLTLSAEESVWIEERLETFNQLGFGLEFLGDRHLVVREVPYLFNKPMTVDKVRDLLDRLQHTNAHNLYELKESDIIQMSCKSAIKANDKLDASECKALIESLMMLENPFTCPHGRPTIVSLKKTDIEKIFKRIQ